MTAPHPQPTPAFAATLAVVDATLLHRARTSADVLTGLLAAGTLAHAGRPTALPHLLWPDLDPQRVWEVWNAGCVTGHWAGRYLSRGRWDTADLDEARAALAAAGYERMAAAVHAAAYAAPSRHPAAPGVADAGGVAEAPGRTTPAAGNGPQPGPGLNAGPARAPWTRCSPDPGWEQP